MTKVQYLMTTGAQSILDFALLFGIVVSLLVVIGPYIRRGIQGMVRTVADQIGDQQGAEQHVGKGTRGFVSQLNPGLQFINTDSEGLLVSSHTAAQAKSEKDTSVFDALFTYGISDAVSTQSNALINLGLTERIR